MAFNEFQDEQPKQGIKAFPTGWNLQKAANVIRLLQNLNRDVLAIPTFLFDPLTGKAFNSANPLPTTAIFSGTINNVKILDSIGNLITNANPFPINIENFPTFAKDFTCKDGSPNNLTSSNTIYNFELLIPPGVIVAGSPLAIAVESTDVSHNPTAAALMVLTLPVGTTTVPIVLRKQYGLRGKTLLASTAHLEVILSGGIKTGSEIQVNGVYD